MNENNPFPVPERLIGGEELGSRARLEYLENTAPIAHEGGDFLRTIIRVRDVKFFFSFFLFVFFLFFARSAHLQIVENRKFQTAAERNRVRLVKIRPERGMIVDRRGEALAGNRPQFVARITSADIPTAESDRSAAIEAMSRLLEMTPEDLRERIREASAAPYEPLTVSDSLDYERAMTLLVQSESLPGLTVGLESRRSYPLSESARKIWSHVLGYVGALTADEYRTRTERYALDDRIGKVGIEAALEDTLHGEYGTRRVEVDALGKSIGVLAEDPARNGGTVILSIDARWQRALTAAMERGLSLARAKRGAAVAVDPSSGEVLAMVSFPNYDQAIFTDGVDKEAYAALVNDENLPLFNRAIAGEYPSGSSIKPVMAAAALQEKIITPWTQFLSVGGIRIGQWFFPDWKAGGHGWIDVRRAIAESVNTFFYIVGGGYGEAAGLGPERIGRYLEFFGLGRKSGVNLPGERAGWVPTPAWKREKIGEVWYIGDTYHLSIGQGYLLVTPLQMAMATAAITNGGFLYRPTLVHGIEDPQTKETRLSSAVSAEVPVDAEYLKTVRAGMRDTVLSGSARRLGTLPFAVSGKTGTAQWNTTKKNHAWFVGFAPSDKPQIVVSIIIEEGGEGSEAAVPVAEEFLRAWWLTRPGAERGG